MTDLEILKQAKADLLAGRFDDDDKMNFVMGLWDLERALDLDDLSETERLEHEELLEIKKIVDASFKAIPEVYTQKVEKGEWFMSNGAVYGPDGKLCEDGWRAPRSGMLRITTEKLKGPVAEFGVLPRTYLEWVRPKR